MTQSIVDRYQGFVFDLDGTVYLGDELLPGALEAVAAVRRAGRRLLFLTNKPLEPTASYATKLTDLGLPTDPSEVVSSLDALVGYLVRRQPGSRVLVVGEPLIEAELSRHGFVVVDHADASEAHTVVVSFDRTFDYEKLHAAFRAVRAGATIVATNPDRYCPTPDGGLPDCAAMLAAVEACTGAVAEAIVGKPSPHMATILLERIGLAPGDVLLVGDRFETDVAMATAAGMDSGLVLTGATTRAQALALDPPPTHLFNDLSELLSNSPEYRIK